MTAIKQDGPYDSRTLTKVFCGSSIALAASIVWMVMDDHVRPWQAYQEGFRAIEVARAQADVDEARRTMDTATVDKDHKQVNALVADDAAITAAQAEVDGKSAALATAQAELRAAQSEQEKANLNYSVAKSFVDSFTYFKEEDGAEHLLSKATDASESLEVAVDRLEKCDEAKQAANHLVDEKTAAVAAIEKPLTDAKKALEQLGADLDRTSRKYRAIGPGFMNDWFRNKPLVDFLDRNIKEKQIVLNGLRDDYYFAQVRKVDRCISCHLGIDRRGFEGSIVHIEGKGLVSVADVKEIGGGYDITLAASTGGMPHVDHVKDADPKSPATGDLNKMNGKAALTIDPVFRSHPNLDLYLSSSSPHPIEKFGCTVCHMGEGESITFTTATHSPNDEHQREEWSQSATLKWQEREHWLWPQFPERYVQASCLLCHANNRPVPGADKLNFGREVWERLSCVGCHKMKGYEDEAKRGPDLRRVSQKLTKDWVAYWIADPTRFRPKTNMPRFFGLAQPTAAEKEEAKKASARDPSKRLYDYDVREQVEIRAITEYLFDSSADFVAKTPGEFELPAWQTGDAARGKALFTARGCVGCHRIEPVQVERDALRTYAPDEFGPNLYNVAWKIQKPEWIQKWVSNPKHYWSETRMPNLRIPDDEARDLATYLTEGVPDAAGVSDVKDKDGLGVASLAEIAPQSPQEIQLKYACLDYLEKDYTNTEISQIFAGKARAEPGKPEYPSLPDTASRLQYLGKATINRAGCFGCHFVKGMETQPGIGRELTDIGDKNLNQVDWGFVSVSRFQEAPPPVGKIRENRHEWLTKKVQDPRCFDEGKVKAPLDRSRMPRFRTTPFEREALVTYLLGNTQNRKVSQEYRYKPAVRRANVIEGEYAIQRNNCKACHLLGVDKIALTASTGGKLAVVTKPVLDMKTKLPVVSPISGAPITEKCYVDGFLLLDNTKMLGDSGAAVVELFQNVEGGPEVGSLQGKMAGDNLAVAQTDASLWKGLDETRSPIIGADADLEKVIDETPADVWAISEGGEKDSKARQLDAIKKSLGWRNRGGTALDKVIRARVAAKLGFSPWDPSCKDKFDCEQLPIAELEDAKAYGPPHLVNEGLKIQPLWLQSFLKEPVEIRPSLRPAAEWSKREITASILNAGGPKMPTYGFRDAETQAISRYFAATEEEHRLAKVTPLLEELQSKVKLKEPKYRTRAEITKLVYDTLDAFTAREYFTIGIADGVFNYTPRADVSLSRALEEKTDGFMAIEEAKRPGWYGAGYQMFVNPDVNCQKCHVVKGQLPGGTVDAWAPDLARVRERLRPDYLREWIGNPKSIVPGTKMPQLILPGKLQNILKGDEKYQITAIVDWLMAGVPSVAEAFPKTPKAGNEVRVTSDLLSLDAVKEIVVQDAGGGDPQKLVEGEDGFVREKSAERTVALRLKIAGAAKGKAYLVTMKDGRYTATVEVTVAAD